MRSRRPGAELLILSVIALVVALVVKTLLLQVFYIPSASMENTLQGGNPACNLCGSSPGHPFDRVLVNKLVYDFRSPRRGEVVVFKGPPGWQDLTDPAPRNPLTRLFHDAARAVGVAPAGGTDFIKRVIGVGGDTISCQHDALSVNGRTLNEPFLYPGSHPCSGDGFNGKTVHVRRGDIFVMGDHRDDSDDSRVPTQGPVPVSDVVGRAFVVIWPMSSWKGLPVPAGFAVGHHRSSSECVSVAVALAAVLLIGLYVARRYATRRSRKVGHDEPAEGQNRIC